MRARLLLVALWVSGAGCALDAPTAHERLDQGECASCHEDAGPVSHDAETWALDHGRAEPWLVRACASCHAPDDCQACHVRAPSTHTVGFRRPGGGGDAGDGDRHAVLGRLAPSTCLTCHSQGFAASCASCHTLLEVEPWEAEARRVLRRWQGLIRLPTRGPTGGRP